ncbi:MAG: T9SS type A sorting domain-containing protein [Flavobacteriales bacterium]|nr:T9SS type A sorting domain-containing protein [Flavobacteriales bacterium]
MKKNDSLGNSSTPFRIPWQAGLVVIATAFAGAAQAQVVLSEDFTGGASTTGFTVADTASDCSWTYAPGGLTPNAFSQDFGGALPSGAGFDSDFVFLDSDECGGSGISVNSYLVSPAFDASASGNYILTFSHQFRARLASFARVEVYNGTSWVEVAYYTATDVGYPNPAVSTNINITTATGGSSMAQVRFQFNAGWDWWWALDNIVIERASCVAPENLEVTSITTDGGTISWMDNGSAGYEWAVTTGAIPNGTNEIASGDGTNLSITGLASGTPYTAWVRSDCGDGTFSNWSNGFPFTTGITNDECSGAIALTVNPDYGCAAVTAGTVAGATASNITSTCGGTADDDVWFSFTATDTAHHMSLSNITGSATDMFMALWTGDCGSLTLVPNSCSDPNNKLVGGLMVGTTYYLQVYTYTSIPGQNTTFNVCIGTPPPPPANDECHGAFGLTVNPNYSCSAVTAGTVASATPSNVTSTCSGTADDDVWFSFTATDTLHRISLIDITGSTTDMYMALWSGDCGSLTLVPNSCSDPQTLNIGGLTVGTTYFLQVYTWTSTPGQTSAFNVCIGTDFGNAVAEIDAPLPLSVYPNPASTELFINTADGKPAYVKVYDMVGHLALVHKMTSRLNISELAPGSYNVVITDEEGNTRAHTRFVKQ